MTELMVIAEAGVNHNGDLERARDMVAAASEAGADVVKFQAFRAHNLVTAGAATADYQSANTGKANQADLLGDLELALDEFAMLAQRCAAAGIEFLCTPFDAGMAGDLIALGMKRVKVASGELTNTPALETFAAFGLPVILSTGMATLDEVQAALAALDRAGAKDITVLHCTSLYPAPVGTVNLRAMATLARETGRPVGYSDHTLDDHVAVAAVALGATVIEKHFTLDRSLPGPDHAASLEPDAFAAMVRRLRETVEALGDGEKKPAPGEAETAALVRRSWHAARALSAGTRLTEPDLVLKRPADGLPPGDSPLGRVLSVPRGADQPIRALDLQ